MPDRIITILLADDAEDDRVLTQLALREARHNTDVRMVEDGEELMDYLHRRGQHGDEEDAPVPNLILLDLNMPRKDGHEALAEIKQHPALRSIPVIVFTTSQAEQDISTSYDLGANSYMSKPVGFAGLVDAMRVFSRYWTETVELPPLPAAG